MVTDMTSEQYRELADLCEPTAENLRRIAKAYRDNISPKAPGPGAASEVADWLTLGAANVFTQRAIDTQRREDAERQLREDIAEIMPGEVDDNAVDAVIRLVRGEQ